MVSNDRMIRCAAAMLVVTMMACDTSAPSALVGAGTRWLDADQTFHGEPRWLGGAVAYSVDLGDARTLWAFGGSFIAPGVASTRADATVVNNTVAVMSGTDLATASMEFAWREDASPGAFFPSRGEPGRLILGDGVRVPSGPLVMFFAEWRPETDDGIGFEVFDWHAVIVDDPSGPPSAWVLTDALTAAAPTGDDNRVGMCAAIDGEHLVAFSFDESNRASRLVRWPLAAIATKDLATTAQWWTGAAWIGQGSLTEPPAVVLSGEGTCSLHRDAASGAWILVSMNGADTIELRTAPRLEGPWSDPTDVFAPDEGARAVIMNGVVHSHLHGPTGGLVMTYADTSPDHEELIAPANADTLYWPHVVELTLAPR